MRLERYILRVAEDLWEGKAGCAWLVRSIDNVDRGHLAVFDRLGHHLNELGRLCGRDFAVQGLSVIVMNHAHNLQNLPVL